MWEVESAKKRDLNSTSAVLYPYHFLQYTENKVDKT